MPSQIKNPKMPDHLFHIKLKDGDLITRKEDGQVYKVYDVLSKIVYVHGLELENPSHFQLTALTIDQIERDYKKATVTF